MTSKPNCEDMVKIPALRRLCRKSACSMTGSMSAMTALSEHSCEAEAHRPFSATIDGNEAAARVAHALSEVLAIYPITPSSAMGESADAWSAAGRRNLWGAVPEVVELQSGSVSAGYTSRARGPRAPIFFARFSSDLDSGFSAHHCHAGPATIPPRQPR